MEKTPTDFSQKVRDLSCTEIYDFIYKTIEDYFKEHFDTLVKVHNLPKSPIKIEKIKFIDSMKLNSLHNDIRQVENLSCLINNIPFHYGKSLFKSPEEQRVISGVYYDEFVISFNSSVYDDSTKSYDNELIKKLIDIPRVSFNKWYITVIKNLVPHIYDKLSKYIMDKLDISLSTHSIELNKVYSKEMMMNLIGKTNLSYYSDSCKQEVIDKYLEKLPYIYEPYVGMCADNITRLINLYSGDMISFYHKITHLFGMVVFPFRNVGIVSDYTTNLSNIKDEFSPFEVTKKDSKLKIKSYEFSEIIPHGYFVPKLCIGNLLNNLTVLIHDKNEDKTKIIQFNEYGSSCKLIKKTTDMRTYELHKTVNVNKSNKDDYKRYNSLKSSTNCLNVAKEYIKLYYDTAHYIEDYVNTFLYQSFDYVKKAKQYGLDAKKTLLYNYVINDRNQYVNNFKITINSEFSYDPVKLIKFNNSKFKYVLLKDLKFEIFVNSYYSEGERCGYKNSSDDNLLNYIQPDGKLDPKFLSKPIFHSEAAGRFFEEVIYPKVFHTIKKNTDRVYLDIFGKDPTKDCYNNQAFYQFYNDPAFFEKFTLYYINQKKEMMKLKESIDSEVNKNYRSIDLKDSNFEDLSNLQIESKFYNNDLDILHKSIIKYE